MSAEYYPLLAAAIHLAVAVARKAGLPSRWGAPAAVILGILAGAADVLATGAAPLVAIMAGLAAGASAVAAHEIKKTPKRPPSGKARQVLPGALVVIALGGCTLQPRACEPLVREGLATALRACETAYDAAKTREDVQRIDATCLPLATAVGALDPQTLCGAP